MRRILLTTLFLYGLLCHAVTYEFRSTSSMPLVSGREIQVTEVGSVSPIQYGTTSEYAGYTQSAPYKAPVAEEGEWTGSVTENGVTVYYKVEKIFGLYYFFITYSDGETETYRGFLDEKGAIAHAQEVAREKAIKEAMAMPIGSPIIPGLVLVGCYVACKTKRKFAV